jgi:hypothetical protein
VLVGLANGRQPSIAGKQPRLRPYDERRAEKSCGPKGFRFLALRLHEAAKRLVRLYAATGQPQKAAQWREKLKAGGK